MLLNMTEGSRARTQEETEDWVLELPDRVAALSQETDLVAIRTGLVREVGELIRMALLNKKSYTNKDGETIEQAAPDFSATARFVEMLGRWLLLEPDELVERAEKIRKRMQRVEKKTAETLAGAPAPS